MILLVPVRTEALSLNCCFKNLKSHCSIREEKPNKRQCTIQPNRKDEDTQEARLAGGSSRERTQRLEKQWGGKHQGWARADYLLNFPGSGVPTSVQAKGAAQGLPTVAVGTTFWFLGSDATLFLGLAVHVHRLH